MKWLVMIWVDKYSVCLNEQFHLLKGFIVDWEPREFFCRLGNLKKIGEWSENVGARRPYVSVVSDDSEECTKLFHVFGCLHCDNGFDFLWIWFLILQGVSQCPRKLVS